MASYLTFPPVGPTIIQRIVNSAGVPSPTRAGLSLRVSLGRNPANLVKSFSPRDPAELNSPLLILNPLWPDHRYFVNGSAWSPSRTPHPGARPLGWRGHQEQPACSTARHVTVAVGPQHRVLPQIFHLPYTSIGFLRKSSTNLPPSLHLSYPLNGILFPTDPHETPVGSHIGDCWCIAQLHSSLPCPRIAPLWCSCAPRPM